MMSLIYLPDLMQILFLIAIYKEARMADIFDIIPEEPEIETDPPEPYHVYVQTDEQGRITAINSSAFVLESWGTEIDRGWGDK